MEDATEMFKRFVLIFISISMLLFLNACKSNSDIDDAKKENSFVENNMTDFCEHSIVEVDTQSVPEISLDKYTLKSNFAFYQGQADMEAITDIIFTTETPTLYDESWYANITDTSEITGYRVGSHVFIVGEKIYLNPSSKYLFASKNSYGEDLWANLTSIKGLELLDASTAIKLNKMFQYCTFLTELDLSMWDVSNVEDMECMFRGCTNLETLNVANWNVGKVKRFTAMFQSENSNNGNMKLKNIDVSKWNTGSAENMDHMFYGCGSLESIDVSNWNVSNVKTFSHMFADCYNLKNIDISNWNSISVESFDAFFNDCQSLEVINVSNLDTRTCKQFSQMFEKCTSLKEIIGIGKWDVSNASYYAFSEMFHCCSSLTSLDLSNWNTSSADNMARMFSNCANLEYLNIENFNMDNIETDLEMFFNCPKLKTIIRE